MLVAITGLAGSGKDTAAMALSASFSLKIDHFAAPLRRGVAAMFGVSVETMMDPVRKNQVIPWIGKSPRQLLQTLGTEWGRHLVADDIWIRCAEHALQQARSSEYAGVVIPDCRFEDEAAWVRKQGGVLIHIERPGLQRVNGHISENGVEFRVGDEQLFNDGSVQDLLRNAIEICTRRKLFPS